MNSLSWLIYAAETINNLKLSCSIFGLVGIVGGTAAFCMSPLTEPFIWSSDTKEEIAAKKAIPETVRKVAKAVMITAVPLFLIAQVLPSKNTIMLIAASQFGENILSTPEAQKIGGEAGALATDSLRVLRKFINEQLDEKSE